MNRITITYLFLSLLLFSCGSSDNKGEINRVKKSVESVEIILNRYDNNVQSAIDSRNLQYISVVVQEAIDSTDIVLNNLKIMAETASESNKELIDAAVSYTEALHELITIEGKYSGLSNTMSVKEAKQMDNNFFQSSQKAQQAYSKYSSLLDELSSQ